MLAETAARYTGGDLFRIETEKSYSEDYDTCLEETAREMEENARPALASHVVHMEEYDVVLLGYPVWWGSMPMAVNTFLEEYDFKGKVIAPFCTHGGSGLGSSVEDLKKNMSGGRGSRGAGCLWFQSGPVRGSGERMAGQTGTVWGGAGQGIGDRGIGNRGIRDRGLGDKGIGGYELMKSNREAVWEVLTQINQVILGKETLTAEVLAALLAGGHVLLEDLPGSGKTTLALALSKLLGLDWKRVQFTPDVLPSDLTGFSIYRKDLQRFVYQPGAVFCNLLLADEINRTSPKTQSALLEVMEEEQVTVEGVTRKVPAPFFVIATQ